MTVKFVSWLRFTYLQELAACCAVNKTWRDTFNYDTLWQPKCQSHLVKHLNTEDCRVDPKFVSPEEEVSTLGPVGEWRMNFMKENHFWNNWRTGNKAEEELPENTALYGPCMGRFFLNNNLVLWTDYNTNKVRLFDVSVSPILYKGEPFELPKEFPPIYDMSCQIFSEVKILLLFNKTALVYNIGSPVKSVWDLEHFFIINENEKLDLAEAYKPWLRDDSLCFTWTVIGNKLFATVWDHMIHIWDMDIGQKLKEDSFMVGKIHSPLCAIFKTAKNMSPHFVVAYSSKGNVLNCYVYNLEIFKFLPFNVNLKPESILKIYATDSFQNSCAIMDEVVAFCFDNYLTIYKYKTSELLVRILADDYMQVLDNRIYFARENRIEVFNVTSKSHEILPPLNDVLDFEVICNKFLVVKKLNGSYQVWETHQMYDKVSGKPSKLTLLNCLNNASFLRFCIRYTRYFPLDKNECCSRRLFYHKGWKMVIASFW